MQKTDLNFSMVVLALISFFLITILATTPTSAQVTDLEFAPEVAKIKQDIAYGPDRAQRFDVYLPKNPKNAPVIFMVHGGAWFWGDKAGKHVVANKVKYWLPKGYIFISANYRLMPRVNPREQARDVTKALAKAQSLAASWGGDRRKFTIMGHSAGAHLVALLAVNPSIATKFGANRWKSAVILDTVALDVPKIMGRRHFRLYDRVFGANPDFWRSVSPFHQINGKAPPILVVCSTRRAQVCPVAKSFAKAAKRTGTFVSVFPVPLNHIKLNKNLGLKGRYTKAVANFIK